MSIWNDNDITAVWSRNIKDRQQAAEAIFVNEHNSMLKFLKGHKEQYRTYWFSNLAIEMKNALQLTLNKKKQHWKNNRLHLFKGELKWKP